MAQWNKYSFIGQNSGSLALDGTDTTQYTLPIVLTDVDALAIHIVYTSTSALNASATLQQTCIKDPVLTDDTNWIDDTDVTFSGATGSSTQEIVNIGNVGAGLIRVKLARSSGTGSAVVYWALKKKR